MATRYCYLRAAFPSLLRVDSLSLIRPSREASERRILVSGEVDRCLVCSTGLSWLRVAGLSIVKDTMALAAALFYGRVAWSITLLCFLDFLLVRYSKSIPLEHEPELFLVPKGRELLQV